MSFVHLASKERQTEARTRGQAANRERNHSNGRWLPVEVPPGLIERLREYPNGTRVAKQFGVSKKYVVRLAKHFGIELQGRKMHSGARHPDATIRDMRDAFAACGSLGKAARQVGISYDTAKEWCRIYAWRALEKAEPEIGRWRCDCGRLNTGKDCTQCGNVPAWAKPDEKWTG